MTDAYRNMRTYTVWAKAKQPHGTFKFWSGLNANIFLYVKKADRKKYLPIISCYISKILTTKLDIFMQLNHALSVVFHSRKNFKKLSTDRES